MSWIIISFGEANLPRQSELLKQVQTTPGQVKFLQKPFKVTREDVIYTISPTYKYSISGVVGARKDPTKSSSQETGKDLLYTEELCLIWGKNITIDAYNRFKYQITESGCSASVKSGEDDWIKRIDLSSMSNNKILPAFDEIRTVLSKIRGGDQIYIEGYLVNYGNDQWLKKTSTSRIDSGTNSSEIIWVTKIDILRRGHIIARSIMRYSIYSLMSCFIVLLSLYLFRPNESEVGMVPLEKYKPKNK